jgi:hypothetical protein
VKPPPGPKASSLSALHTPATRAPVIIVSATISSPKILPQANCLAHEVCEVGREKAWVAEAAGGLVGAGDVGRGDVGPARCAPNRDLPAGVHRRVRGFPERAGAWQIGSRTGLELATAPLCGREAEQRSASLYGRMLWQSSAFERFVW